MPSHSFAASPFFSKARSRRLPDGRLNGLARIVALVTALALLPGQAALAATQTWTGATSGAWETTSNWSTTTPGSTDIALWDSSSANLSVTLGSPESVLGLQVTNPSGTVTLSGSTLTIGIGGIDMSAATQSLTIGSGLTLGVGNQTWNVATGQTLTLTGALTRSAGATLLIDKSTNTGTVTASPTLVNSIVGPWAIIKNNNTAASNDTANGYTFATVTGGNIVAYTGATAETSAGSAWGGIGSGDNHTVNYDLSAAGSLAVTGVQRNVNTIRYTGAGATQQSNGNASNLLIINGILNAGTGTFAIGGGSKFLGIQIGTTNELVLAAETAGITINNSIQNNGASNGGTAGGTGGTASGLTIVGAGGNAVTLAGASTYTGATTINAGGTLQLGSAGTTGAISTSSAITDNGTLIINRTNAVAQGTDFSGSAINGSGGLTQAGTGTTTLSAANTYTGATTVNAGTLKAGVASVANVSGAFGNNSAVTMANVATAVLDITGFNTQIGSLSGGGATGGNVTLGAATLTTGADNTSTSYAGVISGVGGSFTKIGSGTQTLTGASSFTGPTTISSGALIIGGAGKLGAGSYAGNISNAGALSFSSSANQTFSGSLTGNGTLTKDTSTTSTLALSGNSSYTGATTISAGTLTFAGTGSVGSVSVADSATLGARLSSTSASVIAPTNLTFGTSSASNFALDFNSLSNPSVAAVALSGMLTLNGTVNVSLANAGGLGNATNSLQLLSYASQAGAGAFSLATTSSGHTTFALNDTATALFLNVTAATNFWTGASSNIWDIGTAGGGTGSHNWSLSDQVYLDGDSVAFDDTASQFNVNIASTVSPSSVTFANSSAHTYTLSGAGIAGSGALTLNGVNGTVILTNTNTSTGVTTIGSGDTLQLGDGTTDGTITNSASITDNGTLIYNRSTGSSFTYGNAIGGTGALTKSGSGTQILGGNNTYGGATTINAGTLQIGAGGTTGALSPSSAITDNGTLVFNRSNAVVQGTDFGTAAITGSGAVVQLGSGSLTLSANNSFSGGVSINAGTVSVANVGISGANSNLGTNGTINIGATTTGGTLLYTGAGETSDKVINLAGTTGGATINQSGTGLLKFSSNLTVTGVGAKTLNLQGSTAGTGEIAGAIVDSSSGATAVTKAGTGTWTLSGNNTYTGATTVSAGTLSITGGNSGGGSYTVGTGTLTINSSGTVSASSISLSNGGSNVSILNLNGGTLLLGSGGMPFTSFNANAAVNFNGGTLESSAALAITTGGLPINVLAGGATIDSSGGNMTFGSGLAFATGSGNITIQGGNTVTIKDTPTNESGNITVTGAGTKMALNAASGTTSAGTLTINTGATVDMVANAFTTGGLSGAGTLTDSSTSKVFTITGSGVNNFSGAITGAAALTMSGAGTQTLSGADTYTGATNVSAGTLIVNGNLSATASVSVTGGGTLQLATSNALNSAAHLTLSAGVMQNLAGETQALGDLTLGAGNSTLSLDSTGGILNFADSSVDTWTGTLTIANWNGDSTGGGADQVFFGTTADLTPSQLADITFVNGSLDGNSFTTSGAEQLTDGELIAAGAVPEPGTWAMMLGGIGMLTVWQRNRRRR